MRTIGDGDGLAVRRKRNQAHSWLEESALPAELQPIARAQQWKMEQLEAERARLLALEESSSSDDLDRDPDHQTAPQTPDPLSLWLTMHPSERRHASRTSSALAVHKAGSVATGKKNPSKRAATVLTVNAAKRAATAPTVPSGSVHKAATVLSVDILDPTSVALLEPTQAILEASTQTNPRRGKGASTSASTSTMNLTKASARMCALGRESEVRELLHRWKLLYRGDCGEAYGYAEALRAHGFNDLTHLAQLSVTELDKLADCAKMLPAHKAKFVGYMTARYGMAPVIDSRSVSWRVDPEWNLLPWRALVPELNVPTLEPIVGSGGTSTERAARVQHEAAQVQHDADAQWKVQGILGKRREHGQTKYRVEWAPELNPDGTVYQSWKPTWEPACNVHPDLIKHYEESRRARKEAEEARQQAARVEKWGAREPQLAGQWKVRAILDRKRSRGKKKYLIEWEPELHLDGSVKQVLGVCPLLQHASRESSLLPCSTGAPMYRSRTHVSLAHPCNAGAPMYHPRTHARRILAPICDDRRRGTTRGSPSSTCTPISSRRSRRSALDRWKRGSSRGAPPQRRDAPPQRRGAPSALTLVRITSASTSLPRSRAWISTRSRTRTPLGTWTRLARRLRPCR